MARPTTIKLYHIVHVDRLASIARRGLMCDAAVVSEGVGGTMIGMNRIKERRLRELRLRSHPDLHVGDCVPFYFCSRSVMLYVINKGNSADIEYRGGQRPIVHLRADLNEVVEWSNANGRKWAFTLTNAGSRFFEDRADLAELDEINWEAIDARDWRSCREEKQAEFLVERSFPWELIELIGVQNEATYRNALLALSGCEHKPRVEVVKHWYY